MNVFFFTALTFWGHKSTCALLKKTLNVTSLWFWSSEYTLPSLYTFHCLPVMFIYKKHIHHKNEMSFSWKGSRMKTKLGVRAVNSCQLAYALWFTSHGGRRSKKVNFKLGLRLEDGVTPRLPSDPERDGRRSVCFFTSERVVSGDSWATVCHRLCIRLAACVCVCQWRLYRTWKKESDISARWEEEEEENTNRRINWCS